MLICNNISCTYGNKHIFDGVTFSIAEGTFLVLQGPNGCGKTSMLHIVAGMKSGGKGNVTWNSKPMDEAVHTGELVVNFIGHETGVKEDLTVFQNLQFWSRLYGDERFIREAIGHFGLTPYANVKCSELSRGWQKRVALARLICCPSDIWILDEPYNNLDAGICQVLDQLFTEKCKVGGIVIISSHTGVPLTFAVKLNIADYAPAPVEYA